MACLAAVLFGLGGVAGSGGAVAGESFDRSPDTAAPERFAAGLRGALAQWKGESPVSRAATTPLRIGLVFHVLAGAGGEGDLAQAVLDTQLGELNAAYAIAGMQFFVAQVKHYPASPYFNAGCFPTTESGLRMKQELAVQPGRLVNIYSCKLALPYIAGYGTLPNEFPEGDARHGVVVDYATFPGSAPPLDRGHTLVHELGHYFGLFHTFQGGCAAPGDEVEDTPAEASASYGCAIGRDTCPGGGADPVQNFMDYSEDDCTTAFTAGQGERMRAAIAAFRPQLAQQGFAIGPGITGNWYDPAQNGHGISIEVLAEQHLLVQWYTFAPDGGAAWLVGVGPIVGNAAVVDAYRQVGEGGRFPPNFDPGHVHGERWGTLRLEFADCDHGQMTWQPEVPGYPAGSMPLGRLTLPAGLSCP